MNTRLTIPMNPKLRSNLKKKAGELGFDSSQALLRYVSMAIVEGRRVTFGEPHDDWGEPSPAASARLIKAAKEAEREIAAGKGKTYTNVEDFMKDFK